MTPGTGAQKTGRQAEDAALAFLLKRGLVLHHRNYRCRGGEIDLVMRDDSHWVFVEVRFRRTSRFGTPQATVDRRKQQRLTLAARYFLASHPNAPCRFDIVGISGDSRRIVWIKDAFDTTE